MKKHIIFVSRLDKDCSLGAKLLISLAPRLFASIGELEITIIGGGECFEELKERAGKVNSSLGCHVITLTGGVSNPSEYFTHDFLFVGVSRAALEAMACSLAVILLGDEGYLGILSEKSVERARATNFTCRDSLRYSEAELSKMLFNDIVRYFSMTEDEKNRLRELSHKTVCDYNGIEHCTDMTVSVYKHAIRHASQGGQAENSPKIAICGYYGGGNLGDETILSVINEKICTLSPHEPSVTVLSRDNLPYIFKILKNSDLFVFGGGSLLQNTTSSSSLIYYLAVIELSALLCKNRVMLSNGIGPIKVKGTKFAKKLKKALLRGILSHALNRFDLISVRDGASKTRLNSILKDKTVYICPDPAFAVRDGYKKANGSAEIPSDQSEKMPSKARDERGGEQFFVFCPNARCLQKERITPSECAKSLSKIENLIGSRVLIAPLNKSEDVELSRAIAKLLGGREIAILKSARELTRAIKDAHLVISQRYHGVLFASLTNLPVLALSNDPKIASLCLDLNLSPPKEAKTLKNPDCLTSLAKSSISHHKREGKTTASLVNSSSHRANVMLDFILSKFLHS